MSDRGIGWAAGVLTRHSAIRARLRRAIEDCQVGQPRAANYEQDRTTGLSTVVWCWDHGREVRACHRARESDTDPICTGEPIAGAVDSTGEVAINYDQARADERELAEVERLAVSLAERIERLDDRYLPRLLPTGAQLAKLASDGRPGCWFCEQAGSWAPPHTKEPTNVGGNLDEPRLVCSGHYDLIRRGLGRARPDGRTSSTSSTASGPGVVSTVQRPNPRDA